MIKLYHVFKKKVHNLLVASQGSNNSAIPDYTKSYKISLPFIVPQNGYIWAGYQYLGWGSYGQTPYILINDNKFYGGYESSHANGSAIFFPVQEGDKINIIDVTSYSFYFIPSM